MRRLGDGVEAALHCVAVLAELPEDKVLSGRDLAALHGLSESYLLKHMRALTAAGVTEAVPGPRGGFRLARAPGQISLLDVVEAVDGPGPAFVCREIRRKGDVTSNDPCAYRRDCFIKRRMMTAEEAWRASLRGQSLADLMADARAEIGPENMRAVGGFIQDKQR
ncbi:Rrf2 family transcriptional regulator [Ruegeria sp. WL0004]|uniref:Rrf2 family transcriptional regulator n=1 Tax=Ruegeria marisflavi TaxID=2984152 RepID=A0ABT2WTC9_9RHOB|nr:Rrf2 family transcriptional regulator [Ruegeria sp. WL0004]MCU9839166.1 Rrf2 family transcriptional regulator [Ruegeria sp. WL0004]